MKVIRDPVFWVIVLAIGLGGADVRFSVGLGGVLGLLAVLLTLHSAVSEKYWFDQFRQCGRLPALGRFWLGCLARNIGFMGVAFGAGHLIRWLWF